MSLRILVANEKWTEFDNDWAELISSGGPVDDLISALELVGKKKRVPRCLVLLKEHAGKLATDGRHDDAARILGKALISGGSAADLGTALVENAEKAWGNESWYIDYAGDAGFEPGAKDLRKAWKSFETTRSFREGQVVYHAGGWGTGQVKGMDVKKRTLDVKFNSGRSDTFPMSAAVDIFQVLPDDDLRAQAIRDADDLAERLKKEPLEILRTVVEQQNGKASMVSVRNQLMHVGIEGTGWTSWWRKTKKLAENSRWFRVTGKGIKTEINLLTSETDPVQDLERQLAGIRSLDDLLSRSRELLTGEQVDDDLKEVLLRTMTDAAKPGEDENDEEVTDETRNWRLASWIFLMEHSGEAPEQLMVAARAAAEQPLPEDASTPPPLWALFQQVPTTREQERCVELLKKLYEGETWLDQAALHLQHAPPGMVRPLIDGLSGAGSKDILLEHYKTLLTRPLRAPHVLVSLTRLAEGGKLPGQLPSSVSRAQALLSLATYLYLHRRRDAVTGRLNTRLSEMLTKGREPLLRKLLEDADYDALRSAQMSVQRGVEESIDNLVSALVARAAPAPQDSDVNRFWETKSTWTTRKGLQHRQAELREILEEKIPAAEDAIGKAASYGDLSENAEWTAAVEERRNLSELVDGMQRDLAKVDLIETAPREDGVVAPGSRVRYKSVKGGEENTISILGPWDTNFGDDIVSYRAPLAAGLLGLSSGDTATLELPGGNQEVEVLEVLEAALAE